MANRIDVQPAEWPAIPFAAWKDTCAALHLISQIVGKYRLAHTPWVNHSWHATLYVDAEGLSTGLIPDGPGVTVQFDLQHQRLTATCGAGERAEFALEPMSVAAFDARFKDLIAAVGGTPVYDGSPNEVPDPVPFAQDDAERPWDGAAVARFHQALVQVDRVFAEFRTGFLGKVSPVHLFWGSFDLAVTRFSGRRAPLHPGGIPSLPDSVTREAYSHEVSSAGFWPGGGGIDEPCFYSYAYPTPRGSRSSPSGPMRRGSMPGSVNSSSLTRRCGRAPIRARRCWRSSSRRSRALRGWRTGTVTSFATWAARAFRAP